MNLQEYLYVGLQGFIVRSFIGWHTLCCVFIRDRHPSKVISYFLKCKLCRKRLRKLFDKHAKSFVSRSKKLNNKSICKHQCKTCKEFAKYPYRSRNWIFLTRTHYKHRTKRSQHLKKPTLDYLFSLQSMYIQNNFYPPDAILLTFLPPNNFYRNVWGSSHSRNFDYKLITRFLFICFSSICCIFYRLSSPGRDKCKDGIIRDSFRR